MVACDDACQDALAGKHLVEGAGIALVVEGKLLEEGLVADGREMARGTSSLQR